jgi:probable phosphoglycerate mutase
MAVMDIILLIRHADNDMIGKAVAGRLPGVHLNATGQEQARLLAERLGSMPIKRICSSPLERALETAEPLARKLGLEVHVHPRLIEIDPGDWAGMDFRKLREMPEWQNFLSARGRVRMPGGERLTEVQTRMVEEIENLRREFPDQMLALFSHGDPIRSALAFYTGIPLDFLARIEVSPASVSVIRFHSRGPQVLCINQTMDFPLYIDKLTT